MINAKIDEGIGMLADAIESKSDKINAPFFEMLISKLSDDLLLSDLKIEIVATPKGNCCLYCEGLISQEDLPEAYGIHCSLHFFCSKQCFKRHVLSSTNGTMLELEKVICPYCKTQIPFPIINEIFDGRIEDLQRDACDRALTDLLNDEDKQLLAAMFTCQICLTDLKVDEGLTLECDHRFCANCLSMHIQLLVEEAQVSEESLRCPSCPQPISVYELEDILSPELFEKFMKFRLRGLEVSQEADMVFQCMGVDCEYFCILDKNALEFVCPLCNFSCCPQCRRNVHRHCSCEQFAINEVRDQMGEMKLNQLVKDEGLCKCPKCGTIIERTFGCEFMTCMSSTCQGRTYFCYFCGKLLERDHAVHECNVARAANVVRRVPVPPGVGGKKKGKGKKKKKVRGR